MKNARRKTAKLGESQPWPLKIRNCYFGYLSQSPNLPAGFHALQHFVVPQHKDVLVGHEHLEGVDSGAVRRTNLEHVPTNALVPVGHSHVEANSNETIQVNNLFQNLWNRYPYFGVGGWVISPSVHRLPNRYSD